MHNGARSLLSVAIAMAIFSPAAIADNQKMVITAAKNAEQQLTAIAGGTNFVNPQQQSRLATLRDALDYQPGIVIQDFFGGNDQPRLNIRGSGIQSNPVNRGVLLQEDGLTLNEADGSFVIGTLEPRDSAAVVVKRGANAREPGAGTLGGSLNFIPVYGEDQQQLLRLEAGSYGRFAGQVMLNQHTDAVDLHLSVSADEYSGYRHHSAGERRAIRSNIGWQINENLSNRLYLSHTALEFDIPFVVPADRVDSAPESVMGDGNTPQDQLLNVYQRSPHRRTEQNRIANKLIWQQSADSQQSLGLYAQQSDDHFVDPLSHAETDTDTLGVQWQFERSLERLDFQLAASWDHSDMQRNYYANNPQNGTKLQQFAQLDLTAHNANLLLSGQYRLNDQWALDAHFNGNRSCRDAVNNLNGQQLDQCWNGSRAAVGAIYRPRGEAGPRWFANLSSSAEAPTFWDITEVVVAPNNPAMARLSLTDLDLQRAVTFEVGGEGQLADDHYWQLSVYRSHLDDELISSADMVGGRGLTTNYSDRTLHQGVELGLSGGQQLHYRLAWNYSDFSFEGGLYDGNQIAGIPKHLISAELGYRFSGFDLSTNVRWLADDTPVDHSNTLYQQSYAIWGLKLDYRAEQDNWRAFIQLDNLSDETYASSYVIRNRSGAGQPTFLPGNGRSINAGIQLQF